MKGKVKPLQAPDSSARAAATEAFLDSVIDGDISTATPEDMVFYAVQAAAELFSAAQRVPIVIGYRKLPHLTRRQMEVLELLNTGKTPKEVRDDFCIAQSTMESHLSAINKALGTHWYWAAVKKARNMGIVASTGGR